MPKRRNAARRREGRREAGELSLKDTGSLLTLPAVAALSIVGILICWIPIWAGIALMQAAGSIDQAYTSGNAEAATTAMRRLKTYFTIFGVLTLVYIVVAILGVMFGMTAGMMGAMQGMPG